MHEANANPVLSVVVPTHNVDAWIGETLTSVLAQDVWRMEVIVVDDASTDGTKAIVSRFAERDSRVRLVTADSRGGGSARNRGVREARGRYLVFCDGDDLVPSGAYGAMIESLEDSGSDIVFGDFLKFSPTDTWRPTASMAAYGRPARAIRFVDEPTLILSRACWNKLFRRDFWVRSGITFPDVPRSNDIVPMVTSYLDARRVDVLPDIVYLYRERPGATSMTARADSADSVLSYLGQEIECARQLVELGDDAVLKVYCRLIWDRDGFVHIAKYAQAESREHREVDVARLLASLLSLIGPPPSDVTPLKVLGLRLASNSQWSAARVVTAWEQRSERLGFADLAELLSALEPYRDDLALMDRIRWLSLRALQVVRLENDADADWADAVAAVERLWGRTAVDEVAEIGSGSLSPAEVPSYRRRFAALVTQLRGGKTLTISGQSSVGEEACVPVLWPLEGNGGIVEPESVAWSRVEGDGTLAEDSHHYTWRATYLRRSLPTHTYFQSGLRLRDQSVVVTANARPPLPDYSVMDSFIYEFHRGIVVFYRRRGRTFRAARRALIITRTILRKSLGRSDR